MKQFLSARPAFKKDERQIRQTILQVSIGEFSLKKERKKKNFFSVKA